MKLFRNQGFDNTTTEDIAEASDVAKRTLYSYFPVKEAIVSAHWIRNVQKKSKFLPLLFKLSPNTRKRLLAVFLNAAKGLKKETEFARIHFYHEFQIIGKNECHPQEQSEFDLFLIKVWRKGKNQVTYGVM